MSSEERELLIKLIELENKYEFSIESDNLMSDIDGQIVIYTGIPYSRLKELRDESDV